MNSKSQLKADPTAAEIQEIERLTLGKIGTHTFGPNGEYTLENSFLSQSGEYIGDFDRAKWYVKNNLMVDEEYPHGVAAMSTSDSYGTATPTIEAMYGYTHRGGGLFKIGDRVFDASYLPVASDYPEDEWAKYTTEYANSLNHADDFDRDWLTEDGIASVIPFNRRGTTEIKTLQDAFMAAKNLSNYLG